MNIILHNDFHNSEVTIHVDSLPWQITDSQHRRIQKELCGLRDCACGTIRRKQYHDGQELTLGWEPDIYGDPRLTIDYREGGQL